MNSSPCALRLLCLVVVLFVLFWFVASGDDGSDPGTP